MKKQICFILLLINLVVCCKTEELKEETAPRNYISASIEGNSFTAYDAGFSELIGVAKKSAACDVDTCITISGRFEGSYVSISFIKPRKSSAIPIYCQTDIAGKPSASCGILSESGEELEHFSTQNLTSDPCKEGRQLGRIVIEEIDNGSHTLRGRFSFSAYRYQYPSDSANVDGNTDEMVNVKNGEFYYHWDRNEIQSPGQ